MITTATETPKVKELFFVETINTLYGKRYAVVVHEEKIGNRKRPLSMPMFPHTPDGLARAKRSADKFRKEAEAKANEN